MGLLLFWQPRRHLWKRKSCLLRGASFLKGGGGNKKLSSLATGHKVRVTISCHPRKKKSIMPCTWAGFCHIDEDKPELLEILASPLMKRAEVVKQLVNTQSDSVLSSPSKSNDEGRWSKTHQFFKRRRGLELFDRLKLHIAEHFACSVGLRWAQDLGTVHWTETKTSGCDSMMIAKKQTSESCFTLACETICRRKT